MIAANSRSHFIDLITESLNGQASPEIRALCEEAQRSHRSPVRAVLDFPGVKEEEFLQGLSKHSGMRWYEPPAWFDAALVEAVPARLALRFHVVPVETDANTLVIACYDPFDRYARTALKQHSTKAVTFVLTTRRFILSALREHYGVGAETFEQILEERDDHAGDEAKEEVNVVDRDDDEASVRKFVNQIIREALIEQATDIHIEPLGSDLQIRYRIDGILHEAPVPAKIKVLQASVISRVKIMSNLDIAERRVPQDGRISLEFSGQPIDVRVATIPTVHGESVSLRLLGQNKFDLSQLGMDPDAEALARRLLKIPNGIVLVTGPTGCGKSTTLYTFLSELNTKSRRIVTIEDPVEHKLMGVMQMAVRPEIDLTFANALRSVLRGDPNVIMIGEMRDLETAEIAVRSALTGHLVFSTLHTNDAVGGITRLVDMGVEPFLISSSVRAFMAQRLVRRLCPVCKKENKPSEDYLRSIDFPVDQQRTVWTPGGCDACRHTGYRGRTALYEICVLTHAMQELVQQRASGKQLLQQARQDGMISLRSYGWRRVAEGVTSVEEVLRVTASDVGILDE